MTHSRLPNFRRLVSGGAEEAGMKGWRGHAADVFTDQGEIEAKKKFAPGSVPSDSVKFHDRFLIIDKTTLIHVGASLNHLGKKCFAFSSLDKSNSPDILAKI